MNLLKTCAGGGKTIKCIQLAEETGGYIVCFSRIEAQRVYDLSIELCHKIEFPITYDEAIKGLHTFKAGLIIDNIDEILNRLMHRQQIHLVTLTGGRNE